MRRATIVFALLAALLSGCGNSELESAVYRYYHGEMNCPACVEEKVKSDLAKGIGRGDDWVTFRRVYGVDTRLPSGEGLSPIIKVESSKTDFDDVWDTKIRSKCTVHGDFFTDIEWSFKNKKLKYLK